MPDLLTLFSPGYFGGRVAGGGGGGGGGLLQPPFRSQPWIKICIKVECDVNYKTVLLDYSLLFSFILYELIMLIYAKKTPSNFHYKSLIKASRLLSFGTYILFNILSNCALKNVSIEINFLCILLFYEFLCISLFFNLLFFIVFSLKFVAATFSSII